MTITTLIAPALGALVAALCLPLQVGFTIRCLNYFLIYQTRQRPLLCAALGLVIGTVAGHFFALSHVGASALLIAPTMILALLLLHIALMIVALFLVGLWFICLLMT